MWLVRTAEDEPPELGDAETDSLRQRLGALPPDLVLGDVEAGRQTCATTAPQLCFWRAPSGFSVQSPRTYTCISVLSDIIT